MKTIIAILGALAALVVGVSTSESADLVPKAPPNLQVGPTVVQPFDWSGIWIGGWGGLSIRTVNVSGMDVTSGVFGPPSTGNFHSNGILGGLEFDLRYQLRGSGIVFGIENKIGIADVHGGNGGCLTTTDSDLMCGVKTSLFGAILLETGLSSIGGMSSLPYNPANLTPVAVPFGDVMISALAGGVYQSYKVSMTDPDGLCAGGCVTSATHTSIRPAVGGKVSVAFGQNWSVFMEYLHVFGAKQTLDSTVGPGKTEIAALKENDDILMAGFTYRPTLGLFTPAPPPATLRSRY